MINKRSMIIAAAIAVPVLALGTMAKFHANPPGQLKPNNPGMSRGEQGRKAAGQVKKSPEAIRAHIQQRLDMIQKMSPDEWATFKKAHPGAASTQQEAIANNKARLSDLDQKIEADRAASWATQQIGVQPKAMSNPHLPPIDAAKGAPAAPAADSAAPAPSATAAPVAAKPAAAASESEPDDQ